MNEFQIRLCDDISLLMFDVIFDQDTLLEILDERLFCGRVDNHIFILTKNEGNFMKFIE